MTSQNESPVVNQLLDQNTFIKYANQGDSITIGSSTGTVTDKTYSEIGGVPTTFHISIKVLGQELTTSKTISTGEFMERVKKGDLVKNSSGTFRVTDKVFVKQQDGADFVRMNWQRV
ncbi:hypothetical protein PGC34_02340 [Pseudomonas kribbensis]|uniref:hypothetical protein n=1 Tax=Pseudomonas kribbensis TaxID=1628086 RepID=UPI002738350D|nr:hypothetical protein [Pseudomonas sp. A29(2023)]MDL5592678.1 hypothetical protein [Bacillus subtilis]